jgi:hypothetical protein
MRGACREYNFLPTHGDDNETTNDDKPDGFAERLCTNANATGRQNGLLYEHEGWPNVP